MADHSLRKMIKRVLRSRLSNARFLFSAPLAYPPGHFYSPICDPAELSLRYRDPWTMPFLRNLPGIDLALEAQIDLWDSWKPILSDARILSTDDPSRRYRMPSTQYGIGDAIIYVCMLRHLQPRRLIEVGSGWSSALALDTFDRHFNTRPQTIFIDPYPALLKSLLTEQDKSTVEIIASCVQDVPLKYFDSLQENDLLFIDSTHIVKTGSDVAYELFEILPRLHRGVVVHFHDVFYPFEYPSEWVLVRNYSWNEIYTLRAFLTGNQSWEIVFFNDYFARAERVRVERDASEVLQNPGGGLWLRRR
jgi:Methyltransferase domain